MTVSTTTSAAVYTGTNTTATYPYTWQIVQDADLLVYQLDVSGASFSLLVLDTDYTVTGAGFPTGGNVVLTAGNLATGARLFVASDPEEIQALLLQQGAAYNPADVMAALDLLTREVQATRRVADNALRFPVGESLDGGDATLPIAADRVSKYLGFDASGNPVALTGAAGTSIPGDLIVQTVATIAALRAISGTALTGTIATLGYGAAGDGGGGIFRWNAADSSADNAGTIIQPNAGGTGRWNRVSGYLTIVDVMSFGAAGNGSTNDQPAIQDAIDAVVAAGGGVVYFPTGDYHLSAPLTTYSGVRLLGAGREASKLTKTTNTVVAASATTPLVCLDGATIGDGAGDVNAVIWIVDAVRATNIEIAHLTIRSNGTLTTTAPVRFGIASEVGFSDGSLHDLSIEYISSASVVLGDCFFARFDQLKSYRCGQGISIEAGTSLAISDCYAIYCHWYGLFLRDISYSVVQSHACDGLNNVTNSPDYSDRTVDSRAYVLNACKGVTMLSCGTEECFGSQVYVYSCIQSAVRNCRIVSPASSYTGANQVALFYIDSTNQGVEVVDNLVSRGGVTALQGGAIAGNHHDLYVASVNNTGFRFRNNVLCNNTFDAPSAIYGNIVPTYIVPGVQSAELAGEYAPTVTITGATGVALTYGAKNKARVSLRDGWAEYDITIHLALAVFTGGTVVQINGMPWNNAALNNARLLCDESAGVTWPSTEGFWLEIDPSASNGLIRNRTATVSLSVGAGAFVSGATDVILHFAGRVYVGDTVSVQ